MKHEVAKHNRVTPARPTRAQRRAMERSQQRHTNKRESGLSPLTIIGGGVTVLIMLAIVVYGVMRSNGGSTSTGLIDPNALNPGPSLLTVGQPVPDFTLRDTGGKVYQLAAQRGHPVLLEFFAVWCPVCQAEAPTLARITRDYAPRGVRVWSVLASPYGKNYDLSGRSDLRLADRSDLGWYARTFDVQHPQLIDPTFATVNAYGIHAYPGLYVINSKGVITHAASGRESYATLAAALDTALQAGRG